MSAFCDRPPEGGSHERGCVQESFRLGYSIRRVASNSSPPGVRLDSMPRGFRLQAEDRRRVPRGFRLQAEDPTRCMCSFIPADSVGACATAACRY